MYPTNVMTMHEVIKAERAMQFADLELRRHVNEARAARKARQAETNPGQTVLAKAHHRLAVAAGTVALLLAILAGAAFASPPGPNAPAPGPDRGERSHPHGARAE